MKKKLLLVAIFIVFTNNALGVNLSIEAQAKSFAAKTANLKPELAKLAIKAFHNAQKLGIHISKPLITVIDYTLPSTVKRLWVLDIDKNKILHTSMVAHGKYSGENYTIKFSNNINSLQTSIGLFLTDTTYFGRDGYSLRIIGLDKGYNDNAEIRSIVMHGAPYVSKEYAAIAGRAGRSWGCPAVEKPLAKPIINSIKEGSLILSYYPDKQYLRNSKYIN